MGNAHSITKEDDDVFDFLPAVLERNDFEITSCNNLLAIALRGSH